MGVNVNMEMKNVITLHKSEHQTWTLPELVMDDHPQMLWSKFKNGNQEKSTEQSKMTELREILLK